ncbi:MAG: hypothetical protein HY519_03735 [Candidatus Aenigmarchaeota archaeon]|nr:hypothetical protein [Candidatus Aenigmarchaeota archaeon]
MVFEAVLIFALGIAIFGLASITFSGYQQHFERVALEDGMRQTATLVAAHAGMLARKDGVASVTVRVPPRIAGQLYTIELSGASARLSASQYSATVAVGAGPGQRLSGKAASNAGRITIYKKGEQITIS